MKTLCAGLAICLVLGLSGVAVAKGKAKAPARAETTARTGTATGAGAATADAAGQQEMVHYIFAKLEYDHEYFAKILKYRARGQKPKRLSDKLFGQEIRRAQGNLPVLQRFLEERAAYRGGTPFTVPKEDAHRVYANLLALLNMIQADAAGDHAAVVREGGRVVVTTKESFGQVRGVGTQYYLKLYRQFFFLMASAEFHLDNDAAAIQWFARMESNADLQALRAEISADAKRDAAARAEALRKEALRLRPVAVVPFRSPDQDPEQAWLGPGLAEVLTADLHRHSDLIVVERSQLGKALEEIGLSRMGFTDEASALEVGRFLNAGTLLLGSCTPQGAQVAVALRLVDAEQGTVLSASAGVVAATDLFPGGRALLLELLGQLGWIDEATDDELRTAKAPSTDTVRKLTRARLLMATKSQEAKALYAQAIREDPAFANLYDDLKTEFKDVSSTVAVLPFVNVTGAEDDRWMVHGIREALSTDLPALNFTVVERAQLDALLQHQADTQVLGADEAREMAKKVGADLIVLGSLMHQAPQIRIDARFVEAGTGVIVATVSVEDDQDDFMGLLVVLSRAIAAQLNERLDDQTIDELAGKKMDPEEFKKFVRQELAKESLAATQLEETVEPADEGPSRAPFWIAVSGAVAGTALAATGFALSDQHGDEAAYYDGLQSVASADKRDQFLDKRNTEADQARNWSIAGYVGVGVAGAAIVYVVYEEIARALAADEAAPPVVPAGGGGKDAAIIGVGGRF